MVEFNGLRDSGKEPFSHGLTQCDQQRSQPVATESDVSALGRTVEGESRPAADAAPTRKTHSRIKPPIIEVIYVPTEIDPNDQKVVYDILADWILKDIEKEMKKKPSSE